MKGKGDMTTYFLLGRKTAIDSPLSCYSMPESPGLQRTFSREFKMKRDISGTPMTPGSSSGRSIILSQQNSSYNLKDASPTSLSQSRTGTPRGIERNASFDSTKGPGTPSGSLNRKRPSSIDSPRNPLRKLDSLTNCLSTQTSTTTEPTYSRVDSPELPAVHFKNVKIQDTSALKNSDQDGNRRFQNSLFDSLKTRNSTTPSEMERRKNKFNANKDSKSPCSLNESNKSGRTDIAIVNETRCVPNGKSPTKTSTTNSNVEIMPIVRPTPLVLTGLTQPLKRPVKAAPCQKPQMDAKRTISVQGNDTLQDINEQCSREEIPPKERAVIDSMLKELGQVVNPLKPNKPQMKPKPKQSEVPSDKRGSKSDNERSPVETLKDDTDDRFVTGIYREPIMSNSVSQRSPMPSPATTPTKRGSASSDKTSSPIDLKNKVPPPIPVKPSADSRRVSSESRSSDSSRSTLTPTSALVASIDGKTMSLLPAPPEFEGNSDASMQQIFFDGSKNGTRQGDISQVKRSPSSPVIRQHGYSSPPSSRKKFDYNMVYSDDERDSMGSRYMSDNSSVVLLQPIELKMARPAVVKQIYSPDENNYTEMFLARTNFNLPKLDRQLSRSSDTLSSISRCPGTPKFPMPVYSNSSSLTHLLQELAADHPDANYDIVGVSSSKPPPHKNRVRNRETNRNCQNRRSGGNRPPSSDYDNSDVLKAVLSPREEQKFMKNAQLTLPFHLQTNAEQSVNNIPGASNPFQIKRRQQVSAPLRYCRSLDYIPSDREDCVSSNASPNYGSPRTKKNFLFPLVFGRNPMGIESLSVSSIASSSEMSRSDPAINMDSVSLAYESEYDNYRPGMASDEDFFIPEPVSDADIDAFDDINIDNVTVSDSYSLDMPLPLPVFHKKVTDV